MVFFFIKVIASTLMYLFYKGTGFIDFFFLIEVTLVYNIIEVLGVPQYNSTSVYTIRHYVQGNI